MAETPRLTGQQLCDICAKHWWKIGKDQGFNVLPIACEAAQAQRELLENYVELPSEKEIREVLHTDEAQVGLNTAGIFALGVCLHRWLRERGKK